MYGWLLESVQHFIMQECGEEIWETILREAGARCTVFSATQQYPDTLMLRLASALARLISKDPNSPCSSRPQSPGPRKPSLKSKPSWRSASVHADGRNQFRCPFTATNALTAATKKEIEAYNSAEEISRRSPTSVTTLSTMSAEKINEGVEFETPNPKIINRRSLGIKLEHQKSIDTAEIENLHNYFDKEVMKSLEWEHASPSSVTSDSGKPHSILKQGNQRKTSVTMAVDVYKRRGSGNPTRPRLNSLSQIVGSGDKINAMKEKFGTPEKVMHFFGRCFVKFFSNYGYDTMIRATGRYFCTFLQSVDSIHQRMRFTFPRMRSPSMQLTRAHRHGAELVYSSTRTGFTHYLMGQLYEIAEDIFSLKLKVTIVKESMEGSYYVAVLRLEFDNSDYVQSLMMRKSISCPLPPVPVSLLLQLFPFGVLLDRKMKIISAGVKLVEAWGGPLNRIEKQPVSDILRLRKPKVSFTWDKVVCMQTMLFELELIRWRAKVQGDARRGSQGARSVLFKGPIYLLEEIDSLIFLCSPIFNDLDELRQADLFLADLNGHGLSREMLLQGWQHLSRLELLFEKAESRSLTLEKSYRLRDQWKKKGDQLLYSMIPKSVAYRLRDEKNPWEKLAEEFQEFESVSIVFCALQLGEVGSRADVMQTVAYINDVYSKIDRLLDVHRLYKVQSLMMRKSISCPLPPVPVSLLLQLFPFGVLLDRKMKIISAGVKLVEAWGGPLNRIEKQPVSDILRLRKPKVSFTWDKVVCMQTMLFELELIRWRAKVQGDARRGSQGARSVLFKGPIYLLEEIDSLIFLCSPIFNDLDELRQADLFLADLNGHGLSREMLLQGWQHLSRLELLFEKAESRSLTLEKSYRLRDQWKKKGDQLLYSMIPKSVAYRLRDEKNPWEKLAEEFQEFESVSIVFCALQLGEVGSRADVMQTVAYINDVYSKIDRLLDVHRLYKVETVGTVYVLVAGAPERHRAHAACAASAALAICRTLPYITIGIHSGPCVAGVLTRKLPRYCLVGDTVNTASRMQTTSEPGKIQVSSKTAAELPDKKFRLRRRGLIEVKGKGPMETFWLEGEEEDDQEEALQLFSRLTGDY